MKGHKVVFGVTLLLIATLVLSGCASQNAARTGWSEYTTVPDKDYTVVGPVVVNPSNERTVSTELMAEAQKLGAHDIINVRLDEEFDSLGVKRILTASAVAIKYTTTILPKDEASPTAALASGGGGSSDDGGGSTASPPSPAKKGFFSRVVKPILIGWGAIVVVGLGATLLFL
jgi:hypothetical protein